MVDYNKSFRKPFTDMEKLIVGIVLSAIPIVNIVVFGYLMESTGLAKWRRKDLPEWRDFFYLFRRGLTSFFVTIAYCVPFILVLGLTIGTWAYDFIQSSYYETGMANLDAMDLGGVTGAGIAIGMLLMLAAIYFAPMALMHYIKTDKFSSAFDLRLVWEKTMRVDYLVPWLVVLVLGSIALSILSYIPYIGDAIYMFVYGIISYDIYAQVYRKK